MAHITPMYYSSFHFLFHYPYIKSHITPIYYSVEMMAPLASMASQTAALQGEHVKFSSLKRTCKLLEYYRAYMGLCIGLMEKKIETTILQDLAAWSLLAMMPWAMEPVWAIV